MSRRTWLGTITFGLHAVLRKWMLAQNKGMSFRKGAYGHRRILNAVKSGDAERARVAMVEHMRIGRKAFLTKKSGKKKPVNAKKGGVK